jgi:hypothetical protein
MRDRLPLFAGLLLLAVAIVLGSTFVGNGIRDRGKNDLITVTGSARKRITSDYVIWDVSITSQKPTAQEASRQLAGWDRRMQEFFASEGVKPGELAAQPISTQTVTSQNGTTIVGYQLIRSYEVRSSRVQAIASVAQHSSMLLGAGVPLAAQPVQYVYTKLPSVRPRLLALATKDAERRAKVLVQSTGGDLGGVRGVDVGVFQVTSPNSTDVSGEGIYDTSTLQKDVTAVVNVTFALG